MLSRGKQRLTRAQLGKIAEDAAARYLQVHGYAILERNWRCPLGEIDIVARQGKELVFVEVKGRTSDELARPADAVNARKQERLAALARAYLARSIEGECPCRFDVVEVLMTGGGAVSEITLWRGAFIVRST
jgi:putative endonuclease